MVFKLAMSLSRSCKLNNKIQKTDETEWIPTSISLFMWPFKVLDLVQCLEYTSFLFEEEYKKISNNSCWEDLIQSYEGKKEYVQK